MTVISVIVGSTREGRFSERPARWGARAIQQLRETAIELQLVPIRSSVHIPVATLWAHYQGGDVDTGLAELEAPAGKLIDDLLWWTAALKAARSSAS
jgi:NAD(P)H-dependent FMN reductase